MFIVVLFITAKRCQNRSIGKQNVMYILANTYYSSIKRNEVLTHAT